MEPIITAELEIIPVGTGKTGISEHVTEALKAIEASGLKYQLTPMGTVIEANSLDEIFEAVKKAHEALAKKGIKRVVTHITIDERKDRPKGMAEKVEAVESKL